MQLLMQLMHSALKVYLTGICSQELPLALERAAITPRLQYFSVSEIEGPELTCVFF